MSRAGFVHPCDGKILKGPLGEVISNSCAACDLITGISLVRTSQVALFGNEIEHDMVMSLIRSRAMQVSNDNGNNTRLSWFKRQKIFVERTGVTWPSRSLCKVQTQDSTSSMSKHVQGTGYMVPMIKNKCN